MATGYTRQSAGSITSGATIQASHFNNEYNQLESAFNASTGHDHSGGAGLSQEIALSGGSIGITGTLAVANGGIGATTLTDGGILLGSGTSAVTAMGVLADGSVVVGDGATDPVAITCFTSSTGLLIHERGGLEVDVSAIADGGMVVGTGTGTMAIRTGVLTAGAAGFLKHEVGGIEANIATITTDQFLGGTSAGVIGIRTASQVTTSLSLTIGTNTQAWDANLDQIAALAPTANNFIAGNGSAWILKTPATARTSLGLVIGTDVQAEDAHLTDLAALSAVGSADQLMVSSGAGAWTYIDKASVGAGLGPHLEDLDALSAVTGANEVMVSTGAGVWAFESGATLRTSIGLGTSDAAAFSSLTLTTDLPVTQGGTGVSTLTNGGVLLGSGSGNITAMAVLADGEMIVGDGTTDPVAESGGTLRTSIGVGTGNSPQFTGIEVGAATDTTLTRSSAGVLAVEGNVIYHTSGTDVIVADGGTGASTLTDGGVLLGSGTSAVTAMAVLADSEMIVGDGTTDPVAESGTTLRTSIGVGTGDSPQFTGIEVGATSDTTLTRSGAGVLAVEGNVIYHATGTDIPITDGGTGSSTAAGALSNLGGMPATPDFTSSQQTVSLDTQLDVAHSIGAKPALVQVGILCTTNDLGYVSSTGDEIVDIRTVQAASAQHEGIIIFIDATNVSIVTGDAISIINASTKDVGEITTTSWRWIVRAWA